MKVIELHIPTTYKEIKEKILLGIKYFKNPRRRSKNAKIMGSLEKDILNELNSGYWDNDISEFMRKDLKKKINYFINTAYKNLH